jgi:tetratricopeptide (TPR) repeat protein
MLKRLSLILLPLALGLLLPPPTVWAVGTEPTTPSQTQSTSAADKRKAKWIVTGTILQMVEQKQYSEALYLANQGVSKYPDFPPFHLARGIALFESGNLEEARPCFEKAKQLYRQQKSVVPSSDKSAYESGLHGTYLYLASYALPNPKVDFSLDPQVTENDLSAMAQLFIQAQKYERAVQITSYAMQKYPKGAEPYHQRAIARYHLGQKEDARADFDEARKRYQAQFYSAKTDRDKTEAQKALSEIENFLVGEQSANEN